METAFLLAYMASQNPVFKSRLIVACLKTALAVSNENTSTTNHAQRKALATAVARDPIAYADIFAPLVVAHAGAQVEQAKDSELLNLVSATWNAVAG